MKKKILTIILSLALTAACLPGAALAAGGYPDVGNTSWCKPYVDACTELGILNGYEDGTFRPDKTLLRGEYIKMLSCAGDLTSTRQLTGVHWAEEYWARLNEAGVLAEVEIPCTFDALQQSISRYEMAQLTYNYMSLVQKERDARVSGAESAVPDYADIPAQRLQAVIQVYAKGVINGMVNTAGVADGSFCGDNYLTRAQAAAVMTRLLDKTRRTPADFAVADENPYRLPDAPNGEQPFALWARQEGHVVDSNTSEAFNQLFFGAADKTCFTSAEEAAPYMTEVVVNVWKVGYDGYKYQTTSKLTVHKYLAADVYDIFQQIFEDDELFPIYEACGARFTDTMRHAWGAAIEINSGDNCEANLRGGSLNLTCGDGWWPLGTERGSFAGNLTEASPFSIPADGSVVKAFADYGWGWGGSWTNNARDFMHFSILAIGG